MGRTDRHTAKDARVLFALALAVGARVDALPHRSVLRRAGHGSAPCPCTRLWRGHGCVHGADQREHTGSTAALALTLRGGASITMNTTSGPEPFSAQERHVGSTEPRVDPTAVLPLLVACVLRRRLWLEEGAARTLRTVFLGYAALVGITAWEFFKRAARHAGTVEKVLLARRWLTAVASPAARVLALGGGGLSNVLRGWRPVRMISTRIGSAAETLGRQSRAARKVREALASVRPWAWRMVTRLDPFRSQGDTWVEIVVWMVAVVLAEGPEADTMLEHWDSMAVLVVLFVSLFPPAVVNVLRAVPQLLVSLLLFSLAGHLQTLRRNTAGVRGGGAKSR